MQKAEKAGLVSLGLGLLALLVWHPAAFALLALGVCLLFDLI